MNYLLEINAFYEWLETHPLQRSDISLWYALMHINNKTHWRKSFNVPISTLQLKAGLRRADLFKARKRLVEVGLIEYIAGCAGYSQAATYSLNSFFNKKGELPDDSENQAVPGNPVLPVKPQPSAEPNEPVGNAETQNNAVNRTQIVAEPDPVFNHNRKDNLPNVDPISKQKENKQNSSKEPKGSLSSDNDERQNQKNLFGDLEEAKNQTTSGTKIRRRMKEIDVLNLYNRICVDLPRATSLPPKRKGFISARLKEHGDDTVRRMLQQAAKSYFLSHGYKSKWTANIDWLFRPNNFVKVLEGQYAFMMPAGSNFKNFVGKPSPLELLEEAYNGIMNKQDEY